MSLLNLDDLPPDPIEAIVWLSGVREQVNKELDAAFAGAYFSARFRGQLDAAVAAGPHALKRVLAYTRGENNRRGRTVRWGDKVDATSTAFYH